MPLLNDNEGVNPGDEIVIKKEIKIEPTTPKKPEVYQQRKSMLLEYKELFAALMKLPDRELQNNLLSVINNQRTIKTRTIGTQTDHIEFKELIAYQCKTASTISFECERNSSNNKSGQIRNMSKKRKRKVSLPQANKESRAKQLAKINKPRITKCNYIPMTDKKVEQKCNPSKRKRSNSFSVSECSSDIVNIFEDTEAIHSMQIEQCFSPLESGLL